MVRADPGLRARALRIWLAGRISLCRSTQRGYASHVNDYLQPHLGSIPLRDLDTRDLQRMFTLILSGGTASGQPVTAATLKRIHATIRAALNAAIRERLIAYNPARFVDDNRVAVINSQSQQVGGVIVQGPPKTKASQRTIALDHTTVAALRRHRHRQHAELADLDRDGGGYVFTNVGGRPITPERLSINFGKLVAASGLPPIRLHDLRHGAASLALQAGADLKVVQDQLGHSSIVLTADTYTTVLPELARTSAEDVARLVMTAARCAPGHRAHADGPHGRPPGSNQQPHAARPCAAGESWRRSRPHLGPTTAPTRRPTAPDLRITPPGR